MAYLRTKIKENYLLLLVSLYVLSVFFLEKAQVLNRIALGLLVLCGIIQLYKSKKLELNKKALIFQVFFMLPLIYSMIQICNSKTISLNITFPLFFLVFSTDLFKNRDIDRWIYKSLNISLVLVFLVCILNAGVFFFKNYFLVYPFDESISKISTTYWWNNFVHKAFLKPLEIHPSYLSLFSLSAINWNLNVLYRDLQNKTFDRTNVLYLIITTLFTILISSKMAYILLLLLVCIFLARLVMSGFYKQFIFLGLSGFLLMISMYYALPSIRDRITVDFRNFKQSGFKLDNKSPASERIFIWKTSLDIIKKEPLGSFCQKTKKTIWQKNSKSNKDLLEEKNAHNNFLEYGLMYGWFGLSVLLAFICYTSFIVFKRKDIVFLGLLLIFLLFSLVESTLVREVGVIFMAFLFQFHFLTLNRAIKH